MGITKALPLAAFALVLSAGGGLVAAAHADTTGTTTAVTQGTTDTTVSGTGISTQAHGHAPLGNDGIVSSISGSTIVIAEESDEGGASYTVDASNATVSKDGTASTLASIAVGDKIFVNGTVNGTSVTATTIDTGHPHGGPGGRHADTTASASTSAQ